jgi:hypothetical protein
MPDDPTESLRFTQPPVRSVDLTLYFTPIADLKVTSLLAFLSKWSDRYELTSESFALPPADSSQPMSDFFSGDEFPCPWLTFFDAETGHQLGFQNDRFSLFWEFKDGKDYEGFAQLKVELFDRFAAFSEGVGQVAGASPVVVRAECEYFNNLEDVRPLDVGARALHGADPLPEMTVTPTTYAFHATLPPVEDGGIRVEVDLNAATRDGQNVLWIDSVAIRTDGEPTAEELLDSAHEQLLLGFLTTASPSQLEKWGRVS